MDVEWDGRGDGRRLDCGQRAHAFEQARGKCRRISPSASIRQIVRREQDTVALEARIERARVVEALRRKSAGDDEDDERERDFDDHEDVAQPAASGDALPCAQRVLRVRARKLPRRRQPENHTGRQAQDHREYERRAVDAGLESHREAHRRGHRNGAQRVGAPERECGADGRTEERRAADSRSAAG